MESLDIVICGARVRIASNEASFVRYARGHFAPVLAEGAGERALEVAFLAGERGAPAGFEHGYERVCRGVWSGPRDVVWEEVPFLPGMRIRMKRGSVPLAIEAAYAPPASPRRALAKTARALAGRAAPRERFYFEIMYHLVYYPLFYLLRGRGIPPMHAGAAVAGGRCIVVAGAQGTGKSTLIAQMLARSGSAFLSDNILLHDGERVYPCHEPLRLDTGMLARMPHLEGLLEPLAVPVPLGRRAFNVARRAYGAPAPPDVVIVPRLSDAPTALRPIAPGAVVDRVRSFDALADEVRSFDVFAAAFDAGDGAAGATAGRARALEALAGRARCFELVVRRGEDPAGTAAALEAALGAGDR